MPVLKMTTKLDMPRTLLRTIVKYVLKLKTEVIQKTKSSGLKQKAEIVQKCRQLLAWQANDDIIFSDNKLFMQQETHNQRQRPGFAEKYFTRKICC
jgi:hypothetical protein